MLDSKPPTEARPEGLLPTRPRLATCERTGAGRRMRAGPGASGPAAEGSARECEASQEGRQSAASRKDGSAGQVRDFCDQSEYESLIIFIYYPAFVDQRRR